MRKEIVLISMFMTLSVLVFAEKPRLAILPFSGGTTDEGEIIAESFSYNENITKTFTIIPRTSITKAIGNEQRFQRLGLTDPDSVFEIGQKAGADFVLVGNITKLNNQKFLVVSILNVSTLQLIAGDYNAYATRVPGDNMLSEMSKTISRAAKINRGRGQKLAVIPFVIPQNFDTALGNTLAELLSIELANKGQYTVLPRTDSLDRVREEHNNQRSGTVSQNQIRELGNAPNAQYVLAGNIRSLENQYRLTVAILDMSDGKQKAGADFGIGSVDVINVSSMQRLANELTNEKDSWKHKWLYAGVRAGFSVHDYVLNTLADISADTNVSFEAALTGEVNIIPLSFMDASLALQTELIFSRDKIFVAASNGDVNIVCNVFQIPLLAKFAFRPGNFYFAGFTGPYIAIPLGSMEITKNDIHSSADFSTTFGLIGGADAGIKIGPGVLFLDLRYSGDFRFFRAADAAQFRRTMFSLSMGYTFGFFDKRR